MMSASRRNILHRIIQIEEEIKDISSDADYRRIKRNLEILGSSRTGSRNISVRSPSDNTKTIVVRRHSTDQEKVTEAYMLKLKVYDLRISELSKEKSGLKRQLLT